MRMGLYGNCAQLGYIGEPPLESCTRGINFTLAFLIGRPPHGYVGSGWLGCDAVRKPPVHVWERMFDLDVGDPAELCQGRMPGVFSRTWSKGLAARLQHVRAVAIRPEGGRVILVFGGSSGSAGLGQKVARFYERM